MPLPSLTPPPPPLPTVSTAAPYPFLPPFISRAAEITCPLARAHHQLCDSSLVAAVMAAALIESRGRACRCLCVDTVICGVRDGPGMKGLFFNLLKALVCFAVRSLPPAGSSSPPPRPLPPRRSSYHPRGGGGSSGPGVMFPGPSHALTPMRLFIWLFLHRGRSWFTSCYGCGCWCVFLRFCANKPLIGLKID